MMASQTSLIPIIPTFLVGFLGPPQFRQFRPNLSNSNQTNRSSFVQIGLCALCPVESLRGATGDSAIVQQTIPELCNRQFQNSKMVQQMILQWCNRLFDFVQQAFITLCYFLIKHSFIFNETLTLICIIYYRHYKESVKNKEKIMNGNHEIRPLYIIAEEIRKDWKKVNFGAVPYLSAMRQLNTIDDMYGLDSAESIVCYFLANASTWRGETARRIKKELKSMVGLK